MRNLILVLTLVVFQMAAVSSAEARNPLKMLRNKVAAALFKPRGPQRAVPSWLTNRKKPIAHRGFHGANRPENSMAAFRAAVKRGLPIELDVHLLSDGKVAVFHDKTLDRMTSRKGKVYKLTSNQARSIRLKGGTEGIPMLSDVLRMVNGRVPVLVELKGKSKVNGVKLGRAVMDELKPYNGKYAVMGFSPFQVGWFKKNAPEVTRGQVSGHLKKAKMPWVGKQVLKNLALDFVSRPHFVVYDVKALPSKPVSFARDVMKKPVLGYTVTSPQMAQKAKPHVDNIIMESYEPPAGR